MSQTRAQLVKGFSNTSAAADVILVDSNGNVGINSTPEAWSGFDALEVNEASIVSSGSGDAFFTANAYYDGAWKYKDAGVARNIYMNSDGIVFRVAASGSADAAITWSEAMRINTDSSIRLGSGCPGIDFSQIQTNVSGMASETLDSYEEGTFTPTFANSNSGGTESSSYTNRVGRYTKIGNLVHIDIYLSNVVSSGLGTSQFFIRDLPFAIKSGSIHIGTAGLSQVDLNSTASALYSFANASTGAISSIRIFQAKDNAGHSAVPCDAVNSGTNEIFVSMTYPTA